MLRAAAVLLGLLAALASGAAAQQSFTVTGRFLYEDRDWAWNGWTGAWSERPVRGADVLVLDAVHGGVLGRGLTQASGEFAVDCKALGVHDIVVRVDAANRFAPQQGVLAPRITVVDDSGARWSAFSPVFPAHAAGIDLDVGTTTALAVSAAGSDGNPFNVFDLALAAWEHVHSACGALPAGRMLIEWPSWSGSWAAGHAAHIADDDGYDDAVILHELGHVVHNLWSDSDSPGGMHWFGDSDQDPRLSFAEGYATFFSATVLRELGQPALYVDCDGADGVGGIELRLDLETMAPFAASAEGSTDEVAVLVGLTLTAGSPAGSYFVEGVCSGSTFTTYGRAVFDVTGGPPLLPLTVTPTSGPAGTVVDVSGQCAPGSGQPQAVLSVAMFSPSDPEHIAYGSAEGVGPVLHASVTVPSSFAAGHRSPWPRRASTTTPRSTRSCRARSP